MDLEKARHRMRPVMWKNRLMVSGVSSPVKRTLQNENFWRIEVPRRA